MAGGYVSASSQRRLQKVFFSLSVSLALMAIGAYIEHSALADFFLAFGFVVAFETWSMNLQWKKELALFAALVCLGFKVSCVSVSAGVDALFVVTALVGIFMICACFYGAAAFFRRSRDLYLAAVVISLMCCMIWIAVASIVFGGSTALFPRELYYLLILLTGFLALQTRLIIRSSR